MIVDPLCCERSSDCSRRLDCDADAAVGVRGEGCEVVGRAVEPLELTLGFGERWEPCCGVAGCDEPFPLRWREGRLEEEGTESGDRDVSGGIGEVGA